MDGLKKKLNVRIGFTIISFYMVLFLLTSCSLQIGSNAVDLRGWIEELVNPTEWNYELRLSASTPTNNDFFGNSVSISGNWIIVGAYGENTKQGTVYFIKKSSGTWTIEQSIVKPDGTIANYDFFGQSVALYGEWAAIGAMGDDLIDSSQNNAGRVFLYKLNQVTDVWEYQKALSNSPALSGDRFGRSVAMYDDKLIVGIRDDDANGTACIYHRDQGGTGNWGFVEKIFPANTTDVDDFGTSVGISDSYAIVGAPLTNVSTYSDAGMAYIFQRNGSDWGDVSQNENWNFQSDSPVTNDYFGNSCAITAEYAAVGAPITSGFVYFYKRAGSQWIAELLSAEERTTADKYGCSIAISGNEIMVGAETDSTIGTNSGAVYAFTETEYGRNEAKLLPPGLSANSFFGRSVAIDNNYAVIGATDDQDSYTQPGYIYIFYKD